MTATAHKLACLIYRLVRFGEAYVDKGQDYYERRYKERAIASLQRRARDLGFTVLPVVS